MNLDEVDYASLLEHATEEELELLQETQTLLDALKSPLDLGLYLGILIPFEHVKVLNKYFMAMNDWRLYKSGIGPVAVKHPDGFRYHPETGEKAIRRMMVREPVRHGKSLFCSVLAPTWQKLTKQHLALMNVSSDDTFATRWSQASRDIIKDHPEFGLEIDRANSAAQSWRIKGHVAEVNAAGLAGSISGKDAWSLYLDDLVKGMADALSPATMSTALEHYDSKVFKRLTKDFSNDYEAGFILYAGTAYSTIDLQNVLLKREPDDWFLCNFAAISGETLNEDGIWIDPATGRPDIMGRGANEALCPAIRTYEEHLEDKRNNPQQFAAMSQGTPKIEGGNLVKAIPEYTKVATDKGYAYTLHLRDGTTKLVLDEMLVKFATVDLAISKKDYADWTVYTQFGLTPDRELLILNVVREKIEQGDHVPKVAEWYRLYPGFTVGVENFSYGVALQQAYYMSTDVPVAGIPTKGDKTHRFIQFALPLFNTWQIFMDRDAEIRPTLDEELTDFPNGDHDDFCDTVSLGAQKTLEIPAMKIPGAPQEISPVTEFWQRLRNRDRYHGTEGGFTLGENVWRSQR